MKFVVIGCVCAVALATVGCANGGVPTGPSASAAVSGLAAIAAGTEGTAGSAVAASVSASPRSGALHVTKECSHISEGFCTITSSNLKAIEVDSRIVYLQPDKLSTAVGSNVILDLPGPGNNKAFGHCALDPNNNYYGVCTFEGGTGKFTWFHASVDVTHDINFSAWYWEGTYSFNPHD